MKPIGISLFGLWLGASAGFAAEGPSVVLRAPESPLGPSFKAADFSAGGAVLTLGSLSPTYGSMTVGLSTPTSGFTTDNAVSLRAGQDISGGYATSLYGSQVGVFGGYADRPTAFAPEPATSWNLGASVGYAGFYLRGAFTDTAERGLINEMKSWQAGFGYATGDVDLRLTYVQSDASAGVVQTIGGLDSSQWMLGGIYQVTPRIRFNADAFYALRAAALSSRLSATPGAAAPQGAGARVGVQLQF